jgi:hypothetical protein
MRISTVKHDDGTTAIYFEGISHWGDFDLIVGLLQQENKCDILSNKEIVYARIAQLSFNCKEFFVKHDGVLGNFLYTDDEEIVTHLEQLAQNVIDSIKDKLIAKGLL